MGRYTSIYFVCVLYTSIYLVCVCGSGHMCRPYVGVCFDLSLLIPTLSMPKFGSFSTPFAGDHFAASDSAVLRGVPAGQIRGKIVGFHDATRLATLRNSACSAMPGSLTPRRKGTVCGDDEYAPINLGTRPGRCCLSYLILSGQIR